MDFNTYLRLNCRLSLLLVKIDLYFDLHLILIKKYFNFGVKITFANKSLEKLANDDRQMLNALGKNRATLFRRRLAQLADASSLEDLRYIAGNFHELKNDRKGQWSCNLDQPYRLIFTPHENPIPMNKDGQYIWLEIFGIDILEIVNYHKEK